MTASRQPRVQEKLRVLLKDKMVPKIPPYSICIGTHTDKNIQCVLKGFPDTDCILLSFMAAKAQRCVFYSFGFVIVPADLLYYAFIIMFMLL